MATPVRDRGLPSARYHDLRGQNVAPCEGPATKSVKFRPDPTDDIADALLKNCYQLTTIYPWQNKTINGVLLKIYIIIAGGLRDGRDRNHIIRPFLMARDHENEKESRFRGTTKMSVVFVFRAHENENFHENERHFRFRNFFCLP